MLAIKKALSKAKPSYYLSLIKGNKNGPRFFFSAVPRLTRSQSVLNMHAFLLLCRDIYTRSVNENKKNPTFVMRMIYLLDIASKYVYLGFHSLFPYTEKLPVLSSTRNHRLFLL